jgi:hypothetical protein
MYDLTKLARFNLSAGSHKQPNDNGDVCLMEAAIIAAGFEHRAVRSPYACPECFSRVIAQYAIALNDRMPDKLRNQLLIPFIPRVAGTADTDAKERQRILSIVQAITRLERMRIVLDPHISTHDHITAMSQVLEMSFREFKQTRQWQNATIILKEVIQLGKHIPFPPSPLRRLHAEFPAHYIPKSASPNTLPILHDLVKSEVPFPSSSA